MDLLSFFKAKPDRSPADQPASPLMVWSGEKRSVIAFKEYVDAEKALAHPVVARCVHKIASSVASVNWYAEADMSLPISERAGPRTIKALNDLLQSPNDYYTRSQMLNWMALNFAVYGRVPLKIGRSAISPYLPTGIYPLTTRFFSVVRDKRGLTAGYEYGVLEDVETLPTRAKAGDSSRSYAHEIIRPNLEGTVESRNNITPLRAIGLPAEVITLLLKRALETAAGQPNIRYIITAEKTLTEKQKAALREQVENSVVDGDSSGQILFLYNTKITVEKLDNGLQDIHSKVPLDDMSRQIISSFGIPVALAGIGAADAAKFAGNYDGSRLSFWQDTLIPEYLEPFATGMTAAIAPPGAVIRFDYDSVEAIAEARAMRAERLSKVTFLTRNEKREMCGFAPLTPEQGGNIIDAAGQSATPPAATTSTQENSIQ